MDPLIRRPFYMMRHGESEDNAAGLLSGGGRDPDLTSRGEDQACAANEMYLQLAPLPDYIVATGLKRSQQTAKIMVGHDNVVIEPKLNERYFGEKYDGIMTNEKYDSMQGMLRGAESREAQGERVIEGMNHHLETSASPPLFVMHAGSMRRVFEAAGFKDIRAGNAQVYQLVPDEKGHWKVFELTLDREHGGINRKELEQAGAEVDVPVLQKVPMAGAGTGQQRTP